MLAVQMCHSVKICRVIYFHRKWMMKQQKWWFSLIIRRAHGEYGVIWACYAVHHKCPYCYQTEHPFSFNNAALSKSAWRPVDIISWSISAISHLPLIDCAMGAPLDFTIHFNFVNALGVQQTILIETPTQWRRSFKLCLLISQRELWLALKPHFLLM